MNIQVSDTGSGEPLVYKFWFSCKVDLHHHKLR